MIKPLVIKKAGAAVIGAAALALFVSGCGNADEARQKKVDAWASGVCDTLREQLKHRDEATADMAEATDETEPAKAREAYVTAFDKSAKAYEAMAASFTKLGVPPVDDGKNVQSKTVAYLTDKAEAYAGLKTEAEKLDVKDQEKYAEGLRTLAGRVQKIAPEDGDLKEMSEGELEKAMGRQDGCQRTETKPDTQA
ncbi:small secreted protein [Streptomyces polyrhachis]|uniref:Small secreted protein n=1 Tax=Streptomyces polyrhachis TaxID=1282885 RepID=A0ABW2GF12_9ACTN